MKCIGCGQCCLSEKCQAAIIAIGDSDFVKAIGRKGKVKGGRKYDDEFKTPVFLSANNLKPYISNELLENSEPIIFKIETQEYIGYKAEAIGKGCTNENKCQP